MADDYKRPGWYPDPDGAQGERWWNGSGWSDSRRGGVGAAPAAPVPLAPVPVAPVPAAPLRSAVSGADIPVPPRPNPYAAVPPVATTRTALTINAQQNRSAVVALVTGLIGLFGFSVLGPVAIVFGILGITKARQLKAQGAASNSTMGIAAIGLAAGAVATLFLLIAIIGFIAAFTVDYSS